MAAMYSFCRYFSVRLGSIMVAVSSMFQSLILGIVFLVWLNNVGQKSQDMEDWITSNQLIYVTELFEHAQKNTAIYLKAVIVFLMLHISTCVLLVHAALKCNVPLIWPFLITELVRLAVFSFVHFTAMMLVKENILDLGLLIALSIVGGFLLLGLYYKWFCVLSLCQCLRELRAEQNPDSAHINLMVREFSHLAKTPALSRQQFTSIPSSWKLEPIRGSQIQDYHYGNMAWPTH